VGEAIGGHVGPAGEPVQGAAIAPRHARAVVGAQRLKERLVVDRTVQEGTQVRPRVLEGGLQVGVVELLAAQDRRYPRTGARVAERGGRPQQP
jgi:hypothetical protein